MNTSRVNEQKITNLEDKSLICSTSSICKKTLTLEGNKVCLICKITYCGFCTKKLLAKTCLKCGAKDTDFKDVDQDVLEKLTDLKIKCKMKIVPKSKHYVMPMMIMK